MFKTKLIKGAAEGIWTYAAMPNSVQLLGARRLVKIKGFINGRPIKSPFIAMGYSSHMPPVKSEIRNSIGKDDGDTARVTILERTN